MTITQNYRNAFTEVYTILDYIEEEEYQKIPLNVISVIENNMNLDYEYEMNEDVDIFNQQMLPETKAILFNFFRDYWATSEQKEKIIRMQKEERLKLEKEKRLKYNPDDIFKNSSLNTGRIEDIKNKKLDVALIEMKNENIFIKILNKIKGIFMK